jgi:peptidoglycan/xylan/chitin deacetylase (PgdA/CDA1 family)
VHPRDLKICLANTASRLVWHLSPQKHDTGNRIPVLCYHRVLPDFQETAPPIYTIRPEQFEAQMAFLAAEGFVSLSLPEYAAIARGLSPAPRRAVLITCDDGYADNYRIAWSIAKKYRITLNLFICTSLIGENHPVIMEEDGYVILKPGAKMDQCRPDVLDDIRKFPELWRPLTWEELAEMQDAGVHLGFHSHHHRILALQPPAEIAADVANGLKLFERRLGHRPRFFALPYGWYDSYTPATITALRQLNLEFIFGTHLGRARLPCNLPVLPRLLIYQSDDLATFQRKLAGAYDWLEPWRRMRYALFRKIISG